MSAVQPAPEHIRELLVCKLTHQDMEMAAAVRIKLASKARLRCVIIQSTATDGPPHDTLSSACSRGSATPQVSQESVFVAIPYLDLGTL
ncbi:hypothetical protein WJX77_012373 [Trebouxia sp. C0004]